MKLRFSPAGVIAVIALVAALGGGTAYAAGIFTPEEEVEIRKLSTEVFDGLIGDASVKRAATAASADTAARANTATTALAATRATTASNSEQLGGLGAGAYQRAIQGGCAAGTSVASINPQGQVTCSAQAVQGIRVFAFQQERKTVPLANGLTVVVSCADNVPSQVELVNTTAENINVNYFALRTGSTRVSGETLAPGQRHIELVAPRLEGQFIWMTSAGVTTLSLHTFERSNFCEVTGTAVTAFG
ncbi:MAG TPA: hypothetical protein VFX45_06260 [Solirubrobacterales bacterium]|nr:hypothetical protein [Solirubrobacterales bacterium]